MKKFSTPEIVAITVKNLILIFAATLLLQAPAQAFTRADILAPTVQATAMTFSATTGTSITASWTNGNGSSRAVFMRAGTGSTPVPVNQKTYAASTVFGSGDTTGTSGWYCVYNGTGSTVDITGLTGGAVYQAMAIEYNGIAGGGEEYLTSSGTGNPGSFTSYTAPTTQSSFAGYSGQTTTSMILHWTAGTGSGHLVWIHMGPPAGNPVMTNNTNYTASASNYINGSVSNGWYCVYAGTGLTVTISNLIPGTLYIVYVFNYNGTSSNEQYNMLASPNGNGSYFWTVYLVPTIQASGVTYTNTTATTATINWTLGNGTSHMVWMATNPTAATPGLVNNTSYNAKSAYNTASNKNGWYCVYNGVISPNTSVAVSGLIPGVSYQVMVMDYNGYNGQVIDYIYNNSTASNNPGAALVTSMIETSAVSFSAITNNSATVAWANGNGSARAVFVSQDTHDPAAPQNSASYSADGIWQGSGTQLGVSGWQCVYTGTGASCPLTGLSPGSAYQVQVIEYTGTNGTNEQWYTNSGTTNTATLTTTSPLISTTGSLAAMSTSYGTASATDSFAVAGTNMIAGINLAAPAGYQISRSSSAGFADTVLIGSVGTIASTQVYLRIAASTAAGTIPASNLVLASNGAVSQNIATAASTVIPAPLTITASGVSKIYGATSIAGLGAGSSAFTTTGLMNGDSISTVTINNGPAIAGSSAAGTYAGQVTASAAAGNASFSPANYTATYVPGAITVTRATLNITATGIDRIYNGGKTDSLTLTDNRIAGDVFTTTYTAVFSDKNAGLAKAVMISGMAISGGASANYILGAVPDSATAMITVAPLLIRPAEVMKVYGDSILAGSGPGSMAFTATGLVTGDSIQTVTIKYGFAAKASSSVDSYVNQVTASAAVGNASFLLTNYTASPYQGGGITITPATLNITAAATNKVYDGGLTDTLTLTDNRRAGDILDINYTAVFSDKNVGTAKAVTITGVSINSSYTSANYILGSVPAAATATILPAALVVTAENKTKISGQANPVFTAAYSGFVGGDSTTSTLPVLATSATMNSPAGVYPIIAANAADQNYAITYLLGILTITPNTLTGDTLKTDTLAGDTLKGSTLPLRTDADLSNLLPDKGALNPAFDPGITAYTLTYDNTVSSIRLIPSLSDTAASLTLNGKAIISGDFVQIALNLGSNLVQLEATAQDGTTRKNYTLTVNRVADPETLKLVATNLLSPNGDGKNDTWAIKDIDLYPLNKVTVFDVSGRVVFSEKGYTNNWGGTFRGALLKEGTYYYKVDLGNGTNHRGFITLLSPN